MYKRRVFLTVIMFISSTLAVQGIAFSADPDGVASIVDNSSPLLINEVMASNSTTKQDPQGEYDDWIELVNHSDSPIDIGGMYLTDEPEALFGGKLIAILAVIR